MSKIEIDTKKLEYIFENAKVGIAICNAEDNRLEMVNPAFAHIHGYEPHELIGAMPSKVFAPECMLKLEANGNNISCTKEDMSFETIHFKKDGSPVAVSVHITVIKDENGVVKQRIANIQDISGKKRSENALIEKSNHYNQILDNSTDLIYLIEITKEGRFIHRDINNAYCKATGLSREEVLTLYVDEFKDKEFRDILIEKFSSCLKAETKTDYINTYNFPAGRRIIHSTLSPVQDDDGRIYQIVGIARDITVQKKDEERIYKSEEAFRTLAKNYPDVVIRYDSSAKRIYVNPAFERIAGHKADELLGKTPLESSPLIAPKYFMNELNKVIESGSPSEFEAASYAKDEGMSWYMTSLIPEFDAQGLLTSVLAVARDITHSKQYEFILQKSSLLEKRMSKMVANLPGFIYTAHKSQDGHFSMPYISSGIFNVFGINPEEVSEDISAIYKRIHSDDFQKLKEAVAVSESELTPLCIDFRVQIPEEEERWFETKAIPKEDEENEEAIVWHGVILDITERKKQEVRIQENEQKLQSLIKKQQDMLEALKTSELRYQTSNDLLSSVLESSPDVAVFALDTAYNYLTFNTKHKEVMLHLWDKEICSGENMLEIISLDSDKQTAKESFDRALSGESFNVESAYGLNELSRKYWHIFYSPIYSTEGKITGVTCFNVDITQRKKTEAELHEIEAKHSLVFQESQIALSIFSLERFMYTEVNSSFLKHTGYAREEIIECPGVRFWEDKEESERYIEEIQITGKIENFEFRYRRKDGTVRIASSYGTLIELNGEWCIISETYDITEKKEAELALIQSQTYLQTIIENEPECIKIIDANGLLVYMNSAGLNMIEATLEQVQGKSVLGVVVEEYRDAFIKMHRQVIAGEKVNLIFETIGLRGKRCWLETTSAPMQINGENFLLGVTRDITERKQMEKDLLKKEMEFRSLAENMPDNIARWDAKGRYIYINPTHEYTLKTSLSEIIGKYIPDEHTNVKEAIAQVAATRQKVIVHQQVPGANGEMEIHDVTLVPELNVDGELISVLGIGRDMTDIYRLQDTISMQEQEFRALAEQTPDTIARYDKDCIRLYANPAFSALSGISVEELIGMKPTSHNNSQQTIQYEEKIQKVFEIGIEEEFELTWPDKTGRFITSHIRIVPEMDANGTISSVLAVGRDITNIKEQENRLNEAQKIAKIGSWKLEFPGLQLYWSEEIYRIFETSPDEYEPSYDHFLNLVHPEDKLMVDEVYAQSLQDKGNYSLTHRLLMPDGRIKYVHEIGEHFYDKDGDILHSIGTIQDITELKTIEKKIDHMVHHDTLTELPNRLLAKEKAREAINFAKQNNTKAALLFLDLDEFKTINDSLGHSIGDDLLQEIASRIKNVVGKNDTISRQGGDEFLIVLTDIKEEQDILNIIKKLLFTFEKPFNIDVHEISTSTSIGIALYPDHGDTFEALLQNADTAMYKAKENGKNTYCFYTKQMNQNITKQFKIQNDLKRAVLHNEFVLHYQPQIDLTSNRIIGAEALMRWQHPQLGIVPPMNFIPIAESSGLIVIIGEWVLMEACRQAASWSKAGIDITIAVNISAVQFKRGNLEAVVKKALSLSGLNPKSLELELTESIMINDAENILKTVQSLKKLGIQLSIDDFGTGYSSLAYLKRFAVDKLKIDQSFIRDILNDNEDAAIVKTIIQMAKNLNLKTIAEGVENKQVLDVVHTFGCNEVQGYYFAKPMTAVEFEKYHRDFL